VSFDADVDPVTAGTTLHQGTWITNPNFSQVQSDPGDLAVVIFDAPISGIVPAQLPTLGLFDQMKADGTLKGQAFTAVGYGARDREVGGGPPIFPFDGARRLLNRL
jgi:hypothetical protein